MRITSYEIRSTARTLAKRSGFSIVAIFSLGVAIGLNTTMYSVLDALINPKVSIDHPEQLKKVIFYGDYRHQIDTRQRNGMLASVTDFQELTFADLIGRRGVLLENGPTYVHGDVRTVAPNFFGVFGVKPVAGRTFDDADRQASTPPAVIGERLVRDLFSKVPTPIGQKVEIQGDAYIVIGVVDRGAEPGGGTAAWILPPASTDLAAIGFNFIRVKRGVSDARLQSELDVLAQRMAVQVGETLHDDRVAVGPAVLLGQFNAGPFHYALVGAVLAVLLVACANIANLQLARGIARSTELATRSALGASRRDIIAHLMLESALLGAAGLVLGLVLTFWGMQIVTASIPASLSSYIVEPQTSWRLFTFAGIATVVCVLLVGLAPAIRVSRVNLNDLIKRGAGTGSTKSARRQYGFLVSIEIGFALVVLCGAALLVRAARQTYVQDTAWDQSKLVHVVMRTRPPAGGSWAVGDIAADVVSHMRSAQDVADAAVVVRMPDKDQQVTATDPGGAMHVVPAPQWGYQVVSPSFLRAMGFGVLHGRDFREGEEGPVAIVDPRTARLLWPNTDAIGHMIKFGSVATPGRWYTVIGVRQPVGLESGQQGSSTTPGEVYTLATPEDRLAGLTPAPGAVNGGYSPYMDYKNPQIEAVVRARANPQRVPVSLRRALDGDARFALMFAGTFDEWTGERAKRENRDFVGALFAIFAALALVLATLGVYGIVSQSVAERRRE
ncbi:MAG: ABC transporter permease, partial [Gemmatimonadaceae bacterium]